MDKALFIHMMKVYIIKPTIERTQEWAHSWTFQMDSAGCIFSLISIFSHFSGGHGGGRGDLERTCFPALRDFVVHEYGRLATRVKFVTQPAKSPDLNVLDNGAWFSLDSDVKVSNLMICLIQNLGSQGNTKWTWK